MSIDRNEAPKTAVGGSLPADDEAAASAVEPTEDRPVVRPRRSADDTVSLDAADAADDEVGNDNIREGRVGGVMGGHHSSRGQGQGG